MINTEEATLNVTVDDTTLAYYNSSVTLGPGENASYIVYHTINETDKDLFLNTVNMTGVDTQSGSTVHMHDSWIVDILHPAIQVNKTSTHPTVCSEYCNGTYIIAVKNIGDTILYNITIDDNVFGLHPTPPDHLHPEDVFSWFFDAELTNDTLNTVNVSGADILGRTVNATDSAFVNFIHPGINITKNANTTIIHEGDPVEFTYFVENIGDDPLKSVNITDNIYGNIHGPVDLDPGENLTAIIIGFPTQNETNTAIVSGFNSLNIRISNSINETIAVLHPRIEIVKTGPNKAHVGNNITYTILVRNTGDTQLDPVNISDPMFGGQIWSGNLDPKENYTVQVNYTVPESSKIDNTATARGKDLLGLTVENQSSWTVDILNPTIRIDKEAPEQGYPREIINYTITIINTGDTPLYSVNVIDTTLGFNITMPGPFTGSKSWIIPFKIPTKVSEINNTATVTAQDLLGKKVSSRDLERVEVVYPVGGEIMPPYQGEAFRAVAFVLILITVIFIAQRKELIQVQKCTQP